jgi:hypothetical protein
VFIFSPSINIKGWFTHFTISGGREGEGRGEAEVMEENTDSMNLMDLLSLQGRGVPGLREILNQDMRMAI